MTIDELEQASQSIIWDMKNIPENKERGKGLVQLRTGRMEYLLDQLE